MCGMAGYKDKINTLLFHLAWLPVALESGHINEMVYLQGFLLIG